jgi:outer membrane protein assembly factor BamA
MMYRYSLTLNLLVLFLLVFSASAENTFFLEDIEVSGNKRTKKSVVMTELGFRAGERVSHEKIKEGISSLRNTNLFSNVDYRLEGEKDSKTLFIDVSERWTTIPIVKLSSGGGAEHITLGVYDPNILGYYIEAGGQYERLGDTNSGVVWFKNPRMFNTKNGIDLQLWRINRLRTKYEQEIDEPVVSTGFLHSRDKVFIGYNREFSPTLIGKLFYEYNDDTFSDDLTSSKVQELVSQKGLPPSSRFHFIGAGIDFGRINYKGHLTDGMLLGASYRYGISTSEGIDDFWQSDLSFNYFKTIFTDATYAQRLLAGFTTTEVLQYWYYLGGLDRIRGFSDNRFAGRYFWLSNSELRVPVWQNDWFVVQTAGFIDIASTSETFSQLDSIDGTSAGLGLRIIFPKVYRLAVRLDYAEPIKNNDNRNFSFGVQQFF